MKLLIDEMFAEEGWLSFTSPLEELNLPVSPELCRAAFDSLPESIQRLALEWGLGDTEVRDAAYTFMRDSI